MYCFEFGIDTTLVDEFYKFRPIYIFSLCVKPEELAIHCLLLPCKPSYAWLRLTSSQCEPAHLWSLKGAMQF